jgi:hypothetical protein
MFWKSQEQLRSRTVSKTVEKRLIATVGGQYIARFRTWMSFAAQIKTKNIIKATLL